MEAIKLEDYEIDVLIQGFPGRMVCHGGLGWSTIALIRGRGHVALVDVGSFNMRKGLIAQLAKRGLEPAELESERYLSYSRDVGAVLDRLEAGAGQAAFLLRPPAVADVVEVARAGRVMPQKSTYFFPKPASGIVFNPLAADIRIGPT